MKKSTSRWLRNATIGQIFAARDLCYEDNRGDSRHWRRVARQQIKMMNLELTTRARRAQRTA